MNVTEPHNPTATDSNTHHISRRTFIGLSAVAVIGAGLIASGGGGKIIAQEEAETPEGGSPGCATPVASPGASPEASPGASPEASPAAPIACPEEGDGFNLIAVDIAFEPSELTIPAGTDVTITIENHGVLPHDFVIDELDIDSELLTAGASTTVSINAPAGTYEFYCSEVGHAAAGMVGTLTVE